MPTINRNPKPLLSHRLRSWKWWVYGDMNSQPREKAPKGFLLQIFIAISLWMFFGFHPWLSTWMNRLPLPLSELQSVQGKVIYTSRNNPHLGLRLETGVVLNMEYPGFMGNSFKNTGGPKSLGHENSNVFGCAATVWFDIPKYTLWRRYRVWQIICNDRKTEVTYEEFLADSERSMGGWGSGLLTFFFLPLFIGIWLIRFKRGFYER